VLDPQVLLDPFEEQFHLPAAFIELGNSNGGQVKVISQEYQHLPVLRVSVSDPAQAVRVMRHALGETPELLT
jgi:hypothetical protein